MIIQTSGAEPERNGEVLDGSVPEPALIPLRRRDGSIAGYATVDAEDADGLNKWRWSLDYRGYAIRGSQRDGKQYTVRMHRQVLLADGDTREVDHINRNKLDNRKANLRRCDRSENLRNKSVVVEVWPKSRFKGVRWDAQQQRWAAQVRLTGTARRRLGSYLTEEEAAEAVARFLIENGRQP